MRGLRVLAFPFCAIWLSVPQGAKAQPVGAYAKASGKCSTAINTGDFAKISIQCTYSELPLAWRKKVEQLVKQVEGLTKRVGAIQEAATRIDRIELAVANQQLSVEARLKALESGNSAKTAENAALRDQLAAVYAKFRTSAEKPGASPQIRDALSALDKGNAAPAADLLATEANATAAGDKARASALLVQQAVLLQTRDLGKALAAAEHALKLDTTNEAARSLVVGLKIALGDFGGAAELQTSNVAAARVLLTSAPGDALRKVELAAALIQLGNLNFLRGQYKDAEAETSEGISHLKVLVAREPDNVSWSDLLGSGHAQLSTILQTLDRLDEALEHQQESLKLAETLATRFPAPATKFSLISRLQGYGMLQLRLGKTAQAMDSIERALREVPSLITAYPQVEAGYAMQAGLLGLIAGINSSTGHYDEAVLALNRAIEIVKERRLKNPVDTFWSRQAEILLGARGDAQVSRIATSAEELAKFTGQALDSYQQAYDIAALLASSRPDEPVYAQDNWFALSRLARVRLARGEIAAAGDMLAKGLPVIEALVEKFGGLSYWHALYGQAQWQLASVRVAQGRTTEAEPLIKRSIEELLKAVASDPGNPGYRHDLAVGYFYRAQLAAMKKEDSEALADLEHAVKIRKALNGEDPANGVWSSELIFTLFAIAQTPTVDAARAIKALESAKELAAVHESKVLKPALPPGTLSSIQNMINARASIL